MTLIEPQYIIEAKEALEEAEQKAAELRIAYHALVQDWKGRLDAGEVVGDLHPEVEKLHALLDRGRAEIEAQAKSFAQKFAAEVEALKDDPSVTQQLATQIAESAPVEEAGAESPSEPAGEEVASPEGDSAGVEADEDAEEAPEATAAEPVSPDSDGEESEAPEGSLAPAPEDIGPVETDAASLEAIDPTPEPSSDSAEASAPSGDEDAAPADSSETPLEPSTDAPEAAEAGETPAA